MLTLWPAALDPEPPEDEWVGWGGGGTPDHSSHWTGW